MDLTDILGDLLGRKKRPSPSPSPDVFKDVFGRSKAPSSGAESGSVDISDEATSRAARELEDYLHVARNRPDAPRENPPAPQQPASTPQAPAPAPQAPAPMPRGPADGSMKVDSPYARAERPADDKMDDKALTLIRAMVNVAKADGRITPQEQRNILARFENQQTEAVQILRAELAKPLDVREFAASVPIGLEAQVYGMSLLAVTGDSGAESAYLRDLAQALRLPPEVRDQLHARYGQPVR